MELQGPLSRGSKGLTPGGEPNRSIIMLLSLMWQRDVADDLDMQNLRRMTAEVGQFLCRRVIPAMYRDTLFVTLATAATGVAVFTGAKVLLQRA